MGNIFTVTANGYTAGVTRTGRFTIKPFLHPVTPATTRAADLVGLGYPQVEALPVDGMNGSRAFAELYRVLPVVYAAVFAIANTAAAIPLNVMRKRRSGELEPMPDHPLKQRLEFPNEMDTEFDLRVWTYSTQELTGNAMWYLEGGETGGIPAEIRTLKPWELTPETSPNTDGPTGWRLRPHGGREIRLSTESVTHFRDYSPTHDVFGQGPVEAGWRAALVDLYSQTFNKRFFQNGGQLHGTLETDRPLDASIAQDLANRFNEKHQGAKNAWRWRVLTNGLKARPMSVTHRDMAFKEQRLMNREELLVAFGVPPVMVGLLDGATYANAREQRAAFYMNTILPKLTKFENRVNRHLAPRYGPDIVVKHDLADVEALQAELSNVVDVVTRLVQTNIISRNEARVWVATRQAPDLEPVDGGDVMDFQVGVDGERKLLVAARTAPVDGSQGSPENQLDRAAAILVEHRGEIRRVAQWRQFERQRDPWETQFKRTARRMFRAQQAAMVRELRERTESRNGVAGRVADPLVEAILDVLDRTQNIHVAEYRKTMEDALRDVGNKALAGLGVSIPFSLINPDVLGFVENQGAVHVTRVNEFTKQQLRTTLVEGLATGDSVVGLGDRIKDVMTNATRGRAERIARTESVKAFNFAENAAFSQSGVVQRKEWLSSRDDRVRTLDQGDFDHFEPDGDVVAVGASFDVSGESLAYPGDPAGSPGNIINCRCTVLPVLEG